MAVGLQAVLRLHVHLLSDGPKRTSSSRIQTYLFTPRILSDFLAAYLYPDGMRKRGTV